MRPTMEEPQDPELRKKAERAQYILYGAMVFFLVLPLVVMWLTGKGPFQR